VSFINFPTQKSCQNNWWHKSYPLLSYILTSFIRNIFGMVYMLRKLCKNNLYTAKRIYVYCALRLSITNDK
jgi:hypothetical protein